MRFDERERDELRQVEMIPGYIKHPEGSILITVGDTKVICSASVEDRVPPFMRGEGRGWVSAEYAMLPRATERRNIRESSKGKVTGRTMEIQRLIGRSLRAVVDLESLGERTIWLDCDVIQADGGTRTASITGAFVAMVIAIAKLHAVTPFETFPVKDFLAATSVGLLEDGATVLDLNYVEDSAAAVDMNLVMTGAGRFVELQGTGEEATFSEEELAELLTLGKKGIQELIALQKEILGIDATLIEGAAQ
ncbi:ribonuclease PH [Listeria weihenstephanensis FSL R9-0317]|uniref:Ribonuclease PH n=1 Tax=Listeria weihenstephanensis TaxID=1006155 RepID=A0A1S7FUC1_9LIST|nr:ribonuclease PH [Listeria weihenstephanensis]AQY50957.1 ribonuclease PH [Listeria weihenstephanensis]EUJ36366.1 ribonuclease PH [Listeria weihenstephanensis FSL R9-0317]MBC1499899.1 ribonuclease PH [Listeria weihenstephanensis]